MKIKSILMTIILLAMFVGVAFGQPVNEVQHLACDTITDPLIVERSLVEVNGIEQDQGLCLYEPLVDPDTGESQYTLLLGLEGYLPGSWTFRAKVLGATTIDPDTGDTIIGQWSGWSNTLAITKPAMLELRYENGFIVCDPQPGVVAFDIYIDGIIYLGLNDVVDGVVRIYDINDLPDGADTIYARPVDLSGFQGDWTLNPITALAGTAPVAPTITIITP